MVTMAASMTSLPTCSPTHATRRRAERPTFGGELAQIADRLGQPFMPHQRLIADVAGEYDPESGMPYYREVDVTVPRQSGKTTLFLAWQIHRCLSPRWTHPQRSAFTAQTGKDARDKWLDELFPLIEKSKLRRLIAPRGISRGMGNESIRWRNGSIIRLLSTSTSSGHSKTLHQAVLDEIWHDVDDRRQQGLRPAMITVPDAQLLVCSTAGTNASTVLNRKVASGRDAVAADLGRGIAYFEWAAPDNWDPADEASYATFMPALCPDAPCRCDPAGRWRHTVTLDAIRQERDALEAAEFRRAYGNRPSGGADMIIPPEVWGRVCDLAARPDGPLRYGVDVAHDRSSASIVVYGGGVCELVKKDQGVGWVVADCNRLTASTGGTVALDFGGPAGVLADQINDVVELKGAEVIRACGTMFDRIVENRIRFRASTAPTDPFTAAVEGAVKKPVGDQWVWSRKASTAEVTPMMAATVAAVDPPDQPPSAPIVVVT